MQVFPIPKTSSRRAGPAKGDRTASKAHLAYVAAQPCAVPGCRAKANVHHLRLAGAGACAGKRSGDDRTVPLCLQHHQGNGGVHQRGDEAAWWDGIGVDPIELAEQLWRESGSGGRMP